MKIRVPFSDTDAMGVVHHSRYLIYLEMARIEFLREKGFSYVHLQEKNMHLPVIEVSVRYRKPSRFDDILHVNTSPKLQGARLIFEYEIINEASNEIIAKARTEHVLVDQNLKMVEPPQELIKALMKE